MGNDNVQTARRRKKYTHGTSFGLYSSVIKLTHFTFTYPFQLCPYLVNISPIEMCTLLFYQLMRILGSGQIEKDFLDTFLGEFNICLH